jgi:mono/diheme cytochrome c family protein
MNKLLTLPLLLLLFNTSFAATPPAEEGKTIFAARCASCHNLSKILTGPALAGVHERRSIDWIISFVKSSQTMVKAGDKDAVALFTKFNNIPMPDHADLSEENIKNIVEFIKTAPKEAVDKAPFAKPSKLRPSYVPLSIMNNAGFFMVFLGFVLLLVLLLLFAVHVKEYQRSKELEA